MDNMSHTRHANLKLCSNDCQGSVALGVSRSNCAHRVLGKLGVGVARATRRVIVAHPAALNHVSYVIQARADLKMLGFYAWGIVALMANYQSLRYEAKRKLVHSPVGALSAAFDSYSRAVAFSIQKASPQPACLGFPHALHEHIKRGIKISHGSVIAFSSAVLLRQVRRHIKHGLAYFTCAGCAGRPRSGSISARVRAITLVELPALVRKHVGFAAKFASAWYRRASHGVNLQSRFTKWLGSFDVRASFGPFCILAQNTNKQGVFCG